MNFLELFNKVARIARPAHYDFVPVESIETNFVDTGLDSLDMLLIGMYMAEIYDIDDEIAKTLHPTSLTEMLMLINLHKKRDPESIEWATELIK